LRQTLALVAPEIDEYVPVVQFSHMIAPSTPEYEPAGQIIHALEPVVFLY
jgi:hypothetical protein